MNQTIIDRLKAPFAFDEVEAKIQFTSGDKKTGMAVFYVDSRAIQKRLDDALSPFNWKNQYIMWHDKAQLCGISIFNDERGEWVEKLDGAECSDIEPIKGGLSDAFKRAACVWGIGRYLYQIDGVWVEIEQRGKGSYIKDNQQGKLREAYQKAVASIFGTTDSPKKNPSIPATKPEPPQDLESDNYTIKSIAPAGSSSQLLELIANTGEIVSAYIKAGDKSISVGSQLCNVKLEKKSTDYKSYNIINGYKLAA
jgi:hypothetical protein